MWHETKKKSCYWLLSRLKKLHIEEVVLDRTFSSFGAFHLDDGAFFRVFCWLGELLLDTDSLLRSLLDRESLAETSELFLDLGREFFKLLLSFPPPLLRFRQECAECERCGDSPLRLRGAGLCLPAGARWQMNNGCIVWWNVSKSNYNQTFVIKYELWQYKNKIQQLLLRFKI